MCIVKKIIFIVRSDYGLRLSPLYIFALPILKCIHI